MNREYAALYLNPWRDVGWIVRADVRDREWGIRIHRPGRWIQDIDGRPSFCACFLHREERGNKGILCPIQKAGWGSMMPG
jgi:hypothetical protein